MTETPGLGRALVGLLIAAASAVAWFIALIFTGWGTETDPVQRTLENGLELAAMAVTGSAAGAAITWAVTFRRTAILLGALVGLMSALLRISANFTSLY